ncbi:GSK3-beta interaction protein [Malaya genurostris]|uniref:GSK3-beta interaction protein n=1 Tax=Malaya genurostris TaxID=325434 RepID=UPI0026F3D3FF|nr:GSK3-beta interaction protein [Malaya genurostris]XP_058463212.1 GSK3-beta interaction protein [Malaya genurostris]
MGDNPGSYEKYYLETDEIIDWKKEANAVIHDIFNHVKEITLSERLTPTDSAAFINIRTLEGTTVCVLINGEGLRIVSDRFDSIEHEHPDNIVFETPYSLLSHISPEYINSFGNSLAEALSKQLQENILNDDTKLENSETNCEDK